MIAIGVAMVQPFLTAVSLDLSARICVVAFSVAIPLLAALVVINRQESVLRRPTMAVHSAGDARLERDQGPTPPAADGPGEAGA